MKESKPMSFNALDYQKMFKDALWFALVPIMFYITAILAVLQKDGHVLAIVDFIPSNETLIAIIVWVLNQLLNAIRKFVA